MTRPDDPRWPQRLQRLLDADGSDDPPGRLEEDRLAEVWLILTSVLRHYARGHATRCGPLDEEDLRDLAAEKALDLIHRFESGAWTLDGPTRDGLRGYLSTVARNGLLDLLRIRGRMVALEPDDAELMQTHSAANLSVQEEPERSAERQAFARALRDCLAGLPARNRDIWVFRVFYEMASRVIAAHPRVELTAAHVDVLLQRTRDSLRACMLKKGLSPMEMPAGTLAELWQDVRPLAPREEE